jgi:hypothetical protein
MRYLGRALARRPAGESHSCPTLPLPSTKRAGRMAAAVGLSSDAAVRTIHADALWHRAWRDMRSVPGFLLSRRLSRSQDRLIDRSNEHLGGDRRDAPRHRRDRGAEWTSSLHAGEGPRTSTADVVNSRVNKPTAALLLPLACVLAVWVATCQRLRPRAPGTSLSPLGSSRRLQSSQAEDWWSCSRMGRV